MSDHSEPFPFNTVEPDEESTHIDSTVFGEADEQGCSTSLLELVDQSPKQSSQKLAIDPAFIRAEPRRKLKEEKKIELSIPEKLDFTPSTYTQALKTDRICKNRLQRVLADAVQQSNGIVAVEAWTLNSQNTHLVRPEGAWWRDPNYSPPPDLNAFNAMKELAKLEDESLDDHHDIRPVQPGQGLVGKLWADAYFPKSRSKNISEFGSYHGGMSPLGSASRSFRRASRSFRKVRQLLWVAQRHDNEESHGYNDMYWVDVSFIANDEEHIPDDREQSFIYAGMNHASGVVFDIRGYQGIVIFFARSDVDIEVLSMESNKAFLVGVADTIGATLALDEPRRCVLVEKGAFGGFEDISGTSSIRSPNHYSKIDETRMSKSSSHRKSMLQSVQMIMKFKMSMLYEKAFGEKKAHPPPSMSYSECVWLFLGSLFTLVFVLFLSQGILFWNEPDSYAFPVGPFGALSTLLFGLTSAPVSQPKNVFGGTIVAGVIGLSFLYVDFCPHWFRLAIGTSTALAVMAKLGVTHPPAGALAIIYASGKYHWGHLALSLLANLIAVGVAVVVNNLNKKRQYPQYWK